MFNVFAERLRNPGAALEKNEENAKGYTAHLREASPTP